MQVMKKQKSKSKKHQQNIISPSTSRRQQSVGLPVTVKVVPNPAVVIAGALHPPSQFTRYSLKDFVDRRLAACSDVLLGIISQQ